MENFRFRLPASQAKSIRLYKNFRSKLLKCCANIYFNKQCLMTVGFPIRVLIVLCNGSVYFREGLMMISSESKHVAQDQ